MTLFKKKPDPIVARARELTDQIAALESQIKTLNERLAHEQAQPKLRSTARPQPARPGGPVPEAAPLFEDLHARRGARPGTPEVAAAHFDDAGMHKYDLAGALRRWWTQLRRGPTPNPRLVNLLATGSLQGMRTLRYERRVARNRFLAMFGLFVAILWGIIYMYQGNR